MPLILHVNGTNPGEEEQIPVDEFGNPIPEPEEE